MHRRDFVHSGNYKNTADVVLEPITETDGIMHDKWALIPLALLQPHLADGRFANGKTMTIFLAPGFKVNSAFGAGAIAGARYRYSNDSDFTPEVLAVAEQKVGNNRSAAFYEEVLRGALQRRAIVVCHIMAGIDEVGADYQIIGYVPWAIEAM